MESGKAAGGEWLPSAQADNHDLAKRSFVIVARDAEAVTQIFGSFSLNWPTSVQRVPTISGGWRTIEPQEPRHAFSQDENTLWFALVVSPGQFPAP